VDSRNAYTLVIALLATLKLVLNAFHINVITQDVINYTANLIAGAVVVYGIFSKHEKKSKSKGEN
jgi:hypothetical protein